MVRRRSRTRDETVTVAGKTFDVQSNRAGGRQPSVSGQGLTYANAPTYLSSGM